VAQGSSKGVAGEIQLPLVPRLTLPGFVVGLQTRQNRAPLPLAQPEKQ